MMPCLPPLRFAITIYCHAAAFAADYAWYCCRHFSLLSFARHCCLRRVYIIIAADVITFYAIATPYFLFFIFSILSPYAATPLDTYAAAAWYVFAALRCHWCHITPYAATPLIIIAIIAADTPAIISIFFASPPLSLRFSLLPPPCYYCWYAATLFFFVITLIRHIAATMPMLATITLFFADALMPPLLPLLIATVAARCFADITILSFHLRRHMLPPCHCAIMLPPRQDIITPLLSFSLIIAAFSSR